jgi:SAM-dependent methyltransferase
MAERQHGYNVSVGYLANFFPNMAPEWLDFCIRVQGFDSGRAGSSYRYIDLGCGPGFHVCLLAAANPQAEFVGVDFAADDVAHGQQLATAAGLTNVRFVQADFLDLAQGWPPELGIFDYVALQGILSWVSPEVRAAALQCVAQASKPGTVVAAGYNSQPGWLGYVPFQHVANRLSETRDGNAAIGDAIRMFRQLRTAQAPLFEHVPHFKAQLEALAGQPPSYLVHEYLTDHWAPLWHSDVARQLRGVGFTYVGSANASDASPPNFLPAGLAAIINRQTDESLREDVQDIAIMRPFRLDIFCREPQPANSDVLAGSAPIHLLVEPQESAAVHLRTASGARTVAYGLMADIFAALAVGPKPVAELMALNNPARPDTRGILLSMLDTQMLAIGTAAREPAESAARFNARIARAATGGERYGHLAAAAVGSGVAVTDVELLLLDTWLSAGGDTGPQDLAHGLGRRLEALGRELRFGGGVLANEELQWHLAQLASNFVDQLVPRWRRLGVLQ